MIEWTIGALHGERTVAMEAEMMVIVTVILGHCTATICIDEEGVVDIGNRKLKIVRLDITVPYFKHDHCLYMAVEVMLRVFLVKIAKASIPTGVYWSIWKSTPVKTFLRCEPRQTIQQSTQKVSPNSKTTRFPC